MGPQAGTFEGVYQFLQGLPPVHRHGVLCGGPVRALCQTGLGSPDGVGAGGPPAYVYDGEVSDGFGAGRGSPDGVGAGGPPAYVL